MADVIDLFSKKKQKEEGEEEEEDFLAEQMYYEMLRLANMHIDAILETDKLNEKEKVTYLFCMQKLTTLILSSQED